MLGVKEEQTRVSWSEWSLRKVDKGGKGNASGGGSISLEVTEMASDDLLDVDAGNESDPVESPVDNAAGGSSVEEEGGHCRSSLVKVGLIGTYVRETEELGEWNEVFPGSG
eukprot:g32229.t1